MKLIILAAGEGTRLRPHTLDKPKCMVPYNGKPIIDHIIETANACGLKDICIVSGYKEEVLKEHLLGKKSGFCYQSSLQFKQHGSITVLRRK